MTNYVLDAQTRRFGRILHYAGVLATVVGVTASYSLVHAPIVQKKETVAEKIEELKLSVQNATAIREQHQKVSQRLATAKQQIATVKQRVPQEADSAQFFEELSRIAVEERLAIKDYTPAKTTIKNGYAQMEVTLTGRGSYATVCTFFDRLAKMNRLSKLQSLTLTTAGTAAEYPVEATLIIYFGLRGKDATSTKEGKNG
jgi:type IV pilus assembly protein PilO